MQSHQHKNSLALDLVPIVVILLFFCVSSLPSRFDSFSAQKKLPMIQSQKQQLLGPTTPFAGRMRNHPDESCTIRAHKHTFSEIGCDQYSTCTGYLASNKSNIAYPATQNYQAYTEQTTAEDLILRSDLQKHGADLRQKSETLSASRLRTTRSIDKTTMTRQ